MSPVSRGGPVAQSRYRQIRLTATQEISGRFSYALYAKALNAPWQEQQCLLRSYEDVPPCTLGTTEDVISALLIILEELLLPGTGGK